MERMFEAADLDEDQGQTPEGEYGREYHLIPRDARLEKIAEDLVAHFLARGQPGKAMVVCIDKATAVRMYDKVRAHWRRTLEALRAQLDPPPITYPQRSGRAASAPDKPTEVRAPITEEERTR